MSTERLQALLRAADQAQQSFMVPENVKTLLSLAVAVIADQQRAIQELREQYRAPCEGCGGKGGC